MSIIHAKSNTIADFTGVVTVYASNGSTTTANATDMVRPSDWNSSHNIIYNLGGNTAGSSQVSGTDVQMVGSNGITLSADTANSRLIFSGSTPYQFSNSNGVTFGTNGATVTASVNTNYAGTGFTSTTILGALVQGTNGTNGLSLGVPNYLTGFTQSTQTQASGGLAGSGFSTTSTTGLSILGTNNSLGLNLAVPNYITGFTQSTQTQASGAIVGSGFTSVATPGVNVVGTLNSSGLSLAMPAFITTQTAYQFSNSNGVTFGTNGSTVTASVNTVYAGTNTQFNGTNVSGSITLNTNGLTLNLSAGAGGGGADGYNIVSMGTSTFGGATSGATFSTLSGTIGLYAGPSITLSQTSNSIVVSAPPSSQLIGGNNVSLSSAGSTISINAAVGTGFTTTSTAGTNIVGTVSSNGLSLGIPNYVTNAGLALAAGGNNFGVGSSTLVFANSNNVSFGLSTVNATSAYISATVSAPGFGTTFGGTNVSASVTLNTAGLVLSLSAPAGGGGGGYTLSDWMPFPNANSTYTSIGASNVFFAQLNAPAPVSCTVVELLSSNSISSYSSTWNKGITWNYGLYQETNNTAITLKASSSAVMTISGSSNAALGFTYSDAVGSLTWSTANSSHSFWNNQKIVSLPFSTTFHPASGPFFWAQWVNTSSGGSNVNMTLSQLFNNPLNNASAGALGAGTVLGTNQSIVQEPYGFIYSTTSNGLPASLAYSVASIYSNYQPWIYFEA